MWVVLLFVIGKKGSDGAVGWFVGMGSGILLGSCMVNVTGYGVHELVHESIRTNKNTHVVGIIFIHAVHIKATGPGIVGIWYTNRSTSGMRRTEFELHHPCDGTIISVYGNL